MGLVSHPTNIMNAIDDYDKMIEWLMKEEDWSYDVAADWVNYNTIRALPYMGEDAPIIMYPLPLE